MAATIEAFRRTPECSFIENMTVDQVKNEMVADYEEKMKELTGAPYTLPRVSERRFELYAASAKIYQALQYVDRSGKRNLLKYTYGEFLDNLAALKGVERLGAAPAVTTIRFSASAVQASAIGIPQGTRISTSNGQIYFATDAYAEIQAGGQSVEVAATCTVAGEVGNGLAIGALKIMVDPVAYIGSVSNITVPEGGADVESDADFADRVYLAPSAYSTAGPEDSYRYWAKAYSAAVGDVEVSSDQAAGTVDVVFLLDDGSDPADEMIAGMQEFLSDKDKRPMNDLVTVSAPEAVNYAIGLTYYINQSDSAQASAIQQAVQEAVTEYQQWQRTIGRDINPSKLISMIVQAGAKRVEISAPAYTAVSKTSVATLLGEPTVIYGGLEDD